ncbi:MAG TPA: hypothetical protein VJ812_09795 [Gemmatimonadaceae bacterium]|jgi:hypothetical protein|nr:hypothetical protein [Gemmatimonadaceae bacterium]
MDPDMPFVIAIVAILSGTAITITKAWLNRSGHSPAADRRLQGIEDRLTRIEQAVDTIAVETERISEGQRFTTKLLADRAGARVESER